MPHLSMIYLPAIKLTGKRPIALPRSDISEETNLAIDASISRTKVLMKQLIKSIKETQELDDGRSRGEGSVFSIQTMDSRGVKHKYETLREFSNPIYNYFDELGNGLFRAVNTMTPIEESRKYF